MKKTKKKRSLVRMIVQIFFLLLIALVVINKELVDSGHGLPFLSEASTHSVCPFGGVVSIYKFLTEGSYVQRIHDSSFVLMFLVLIFTLLFGAVFCGWVCPLGSVQEWIGKIGRKLFGKKYNHFIPDRVDKVLRYLRYVVLIWVLYVTATTAQLVFRTVDPYNALFQFWTGEVAVSAIIMLILVLLASLWIERPWCKYLCPFGAVLGLISKISLFSLKRDTGTCIDCKNCDRVCPMNIDISSRNSVRHVNCIVCLECSSENACPVEDTLLLSTKLKVKNKIKIKSMTLAIIIVIVLIGGIFSAQLAGLWNTEGQPGGPEPGKEINTGYVTGEEKESWNIDSFTTFEDLLNMGLTEKDIADVFGDEMPELQLTVKSYCEDQGLQFGQVRKSLDALYTDSD